MWDAARLSSSRSRTGPGGEDIAVLLDHHHVAVAVDSVIAEIKEIRLRAVLVEPLDDGPVQFARMIDVRGSGHHQDALAAIVGEIGDLELAAANIAALVEQPRRDRHQRRGIEPDVLARKLRALADELDLDEVPVG